MLADLHYKKDFRASTSGKKVFTEEAESINKKERTVPARVI